VFQKIMDIIVIGKGMKMEESRKGAGVVLKLPNLP
jgi:hypothetical protein